MPLSHSSQTPTDTLEIMGRKERIALVSIHGTWAKKARWTNPSSPVMKRVVKDFMRRGQVCEVIPFVWSGTNTFGARRSAGNELARFVIDLQRSTCRYSELYVVAHSHGGSVVAHASADNPQFKELINGVVTLSTPWFLVRPERFAVENRLLATRFLSLFLLCGLLLLLTTFLILGLLMPPRPTKADGSDFWWDLMVLQATVAVAVPIGIVVGPIWMAVHKKMMGGTLRTMTEFLGLAQEHAQAMSTAKLPMPPLIVLVSSGDEASSTLRVLQWLSAVQREMLGRLALLASLINCIFARIPPMLQPPARFLAFVALCISAIWTGFVLTIQLGSLGTFVSSFLGTIMVVIAGVLGSSVLAGVSFGTFSLFAHMYCRFGVESAPLGPVSVVLCDTATRIDKERSWNRVLLNHSAIYLFEEGIEEISRALGRLQRQAQVKA